MSVEKTLDISEQDEFIWNEVERLTGEPDGTDHFKPAQNQTGTIDRS